jgi:hypothetical protein
MSFFTLTLVLPLAGAVGFLGLSKIPRLRPYNRYVALLIAALTAILLIALGVTGPVNAVLSMWRPSPMFGTALVLSVDAKLHLLGVILALINCFAILATFDRVEKAPPRYLAMIHFLLPASLTALWSANVLTLLVSWAIYDLVQAMGYVVAIGSARRAVRSLIFGYLATLLLWLGALISGGGVDSKLWVLMDPTVAQATLWTLACMIRLWVFPFHLAAPGEMTFDSPLAVPLFLGPVLGWGLWIRLMTIPGLAPPDWAPTLAALNIVVGAWLAWTCKSPRSIPSWVGLTSNGAILLASCLAEANGEMVAVAGSISWMLGVTGVLLGRGQRGRPFWWHAPMLVSGLTLIGMPLTLGFVTTSVLADRLIGETLEIFDLKLWSAFLGSAFFTSALVRWVLTTVNAPVDMVEQAEQSTSSAQAPSIEEVASAVEEVSPVEESQPDGETLTSRLSRVKDVLQWSAEAMPLWGRALGMGLPAALIVLAGFHPPLLIRGADALALINLFRSPGLLGWTLWGLSLALGGLLAWQGKRFRVRIAPFLSTVGDVLKLEWFFDLLIGSLGRGVGALQAADELIGGAGALLWAWLLFLLVVLVWSGF